MFKERHHLEKGGVFLSWKNRKEGGVRIWDDSKTEKIL